MPDYDSYQREPRRSLGDHPAQRSSSGPQPGISRSGAPRRSAAPGAARPASARPAGSRPAGARPASARPAGSRPPQRPQGSRPAGSRPPQRRRRSAPRRRVQPRFFAIIGVLVALVVVAVIALRPAPAPVDARDLPTAAPNGGQSNATILSSTPDPNAQAPEAQAAPQAAADGGEEEETDNVPVISAADQVQISPEQLMVNTALPSEWLNVLLLGTDERDPSEPARTDAMIIASINTQTGEVKLTSLLRDTAVQFTDLPKNNGTYRINSANYFGGPLYAIKTVNELLQMNIQYYVSVNFFGFTQIAEALGGIDVDITEAEMKEINKQQHHQAIAAATAGIDESGIENVNLETFGPNTHLNGRQTLAYARVRKVDSDMARTSRQRTVIMKLTEKLRGKSLAEIGALLLNLSGNITTNINLDTAAAVAYTVLSSGLSNMDTLQLPRNGTYTIERRNDQEMLYDTDWSRNATELYNFIYA